MKQYAHWFLRLPLAAIFLYHGMAKLPVAHEMSQMLGLHVFAVYGLGLSEILGSLLMLWGGWRSSALATRVGAAIFSLVMLGAVRLVHWGQWSFVATPSHPMGGVEFHVLILGVALYLLARPTAD